LRPEDLEDCYSQATLELLTRATGGARFSGRQHLENALEQKFVSRIQDRRRALGGRSPMQAALETAMSIGGAVEEQTDVADVTAELEKLVMLRADLRRLASLAERLTPDQRSVLAWQLAQRSCADFCSRYGWSPEKYRKVAQRARTRLRRLMETEEGVPARAPSSEQATGKILTVAGLRLDTSGNGTDVGPNRNEDGPRWRILDHIPAWAHWSVRHPPGL
jgi:DNA-directed RNA polymerase specialized sigma24 family protein